MLFHTHSLYFSRSERETERHSFHCLTLGEAMQRCEQEFLEEDDCEQLLLFDSSYNLLYTFSL